MGGCGRQTTKGVSEHAFPILYPYALSSRFSVPCPFLVGENEKIYSAQAAVRRLNRVAPQVRTEIIPNVGHDFTVVQAGLVFGKVLGFLDEPVGSAPAA